MDRCAAGTQVGVLCSAGSPNSALMKADKSIFLLFQAECNFLDIQMECIEGGPNPTQLSSPDAAVPMGQVLHLVVEGAVRESFSR